MATVQMTALTPMMMPSMVSAVRIMFRRRAFNETRINISSRIRALSLQGMNGW